MLHSVAVVFVLFTSSHSLITLHSLHPLFISLSISLARKLRPQPVRAGCSCTEQTVWTVLPAERTLCTHTHTDEESKRERESAREKRQLKRMSELATGPSAQLLNCKICAVAEVEWARRRERVKRRRVSRLQGRAGCAVGLVVRSFYWVKVIAGLRSYCAAAAFCILFIFVVVSFRFVSQSLLLPLLLLLLFCGLCFAGDRFNSMSGMRLQFSRDESLFWGSSHINAISIAID